MRTCWIVILGLLGIVGGCTSHVTPKVRPQAVVVATFTSVPVKIDGKLDDDERAAMKRDRAERRRRWARMRREWMKQWDTDGDGQLSDEERRNMRDTLRKRAEEYRKKWTARWDADGDGQISDEERQKMREYLRAQWEKRRREMDADGDGDISREEMRGYWERLRKKYDADGDGVLNPEERRKMFEEEGGRFFGAPRGFRGVRSSRGAMIPVPTARPDEQAYVSADGSTTVIIRRTPTP